jgi:hypothetical protein
MSVTVENFARVAKKRDQLRDVAAGQFTKRIIKDGRIV